MRLSEFIQDTLYEIALGVHTAQLKARNYVAINPSRLDGELVGEKSYIDFDVSIVVSEAQSSEKGGNGRLGGEISVASVAKIGASLGADVKGASSAKAEHTHRVTFKVPVYLAASFRGNSATEAEAAATFSEQAEP